jgi:hypothetical protein
VKKEIRYTAPWKLALAIIFWALITGALLYLAVTRSYDDYRFSHHAVTTAGTLVQKYFTVSHGKGGPTYTYHVSYNYVVGNVQGFCDQAVLPNTYTYINSGSPVPLMYLPDDAGKVRINLLNEERTIHLHTWGVCFIAGLFLVAGVAGFTSTFRANAIYQRLLREGQLCRATVTDVACDYVGKTRTPKYYLKLQYRDTMGAELAGRSVYLPREEEGRWRKGNTLDLRYDRQKPRRFIIDLNSDRRDTPGADGNPSSRA